MGHMATCEALQLIEHYFGTITDQQQQAFAAAWKDDCVSPAALEALCAECEDVSSLLKAVSVLISHTHNDQDDDVIVDDVRKCGCPHDDATAKDQDMGAEHPGSSTSNSSSDSSSNGSSSSGVGGTDNQAEGLFSPEGSLVLTSTSDSLASSGDSSTSGASTISSDNNAGDSSKDSDCKANKGDISKEVSGVVMLQASSCFAELARVFAAENAPAARTGSCS